MYILRWHVFISILYYVHCLYLAEIKYSSIKRNKLNVHDLSILGPIIERNIDLFYSSCSQDNNNIVISTIII